MRFTKPAWVAHKDAAMKGEQSKRVIIFSVHVHPDGSRIATGGLDAKVRIWSTKPILNAASEQSGRPPKSLCTLQMHTGPVLVVRWANSGRWLASGSDDQIVMIWDLDPSARGKVWGSDDVNVEGWKPLKRLPGHDSDVTDLAWSAGDRYLATVGLDSQILIWCGFTLERLRKLEPNDGLVKGVCWDPVGEFLATASDDRTVRIWRTTDWKLEAEVRKPFEFSPGTFFRRLSWSPDGAHITASNATNNEGYVFIAAVISRNSWTSDISLVGHEDTVEVASYNPHIFLRDPKSQVVAANICSVVALGGHDRSVSVWQTKSARPLIVAKEVFERQIMDLAWSQDGLTLYAVSSDGTMAVFSFDPEELEGIAPLGAQEHYLKKFGFTPPPVPEGYSHSNPAQEAAAQQVVSVEASRAQSQEPGFGTAINGGGEVVHTLVAKRKKDKKRIQPTFVGGMSSVPSASLTSTSNGARPPVSSAAAPSSRSFGEHTLSAARPPASTSLSSAREPFGQTTTGFGFDIDIDDDVQMFSLDSSEVRISSLDGGDQGARGKRKAGDITDDRLTTKARTLGGDRVRDTVTIRQIGGPIAAVAGTNSALGWNEQSSLAGRLEIPPLLTYIKAAIEGSDDVFEARNPEGNDVVEIIYVSGRQTQWLDYLPSSIIALAATTTFCAAAMQDGSINVYTPTGRRIMPTLSLGVPCSSMTANKGSLMVLTSAGQVHVWDVKKQVASFPPVSVAPILGTSPNCTIISASVRPNGVPIIQLSTGVAHTYDPWLFSWVKLSESWWAEGSDAWQGRQRTSTTNSRGVVAAVESSISERMPDDGSKAEKQRPAWWSDALTLGHLETKLHAARALESAQEYRQALLVYAKKIADEGFRGKAEELVKELHGPVYWRPGRDDSWSSTVVGLSKRDLLKDVLAVFARSKTLAKLAMDWQDTLKKAMTEE